MKDKHDLTDKDFYEQACSYFYYHAEQRTTMINYFIAVFAACLALYGSLLEKYALASIFVAGFLLIVSVIFYAIDIRNRFDVKQSQNVISQFERDYGVDVPQGDQQYAYGVFSNEDNVFKYYGFSKRRKAKRECYGELQNLYKKKEAEKLNKKIDEIYLADGTVSKEALEDSLKNRSIITLSFSIRMLYYMCMIISLGSVILAILIKWKVL